MSRPIKHTDQRIEPHPAGEEDDHARADDADRGQRVAEDVQESRARVHVVVVVLVQHKGDDDVDDQAYHRDDEHRPGLDRLRLLPAIPGLAQNLEGDEQQRDAVGERRQDLQAVVAVGMAVIGGQGCRAQRQVTQAQGKRIHKHVRRVGQQRQTAGP